MFVPMSQHDSDLKTQIIRRNLLAGGLTSMLLHKGEKLTSWCIQMSAKRDKSVRRTLKAQQTSAGLMLLESLP